MAMLAMYVVFVLTRGEKPSLKVFSQRSDAALYAKAQVDAGSDTADVYEVEGVSDARAAKAALEMGEGRFVEARGRQATRAEVMEWLASVL
jgi:hypothetical protein